MPRLMRALVRGPLGSSNGLAGWKKVVDRRRCAIAYGIPLIYDWYAEMTQREEDGCRSNVRILSLTGGGFLGLFGVHVLAALEEKANAPIATCFDLIAGTSIGGIVALALAFEIPAKEIATTFERRGPEIFANRPAPQGRVAEFQDVLSFSWSPKYRSEPLRNAISELLGDRVLGDAMHPVIVPSLNMTKGQPQVFKTAHHPSLQVDWRLRAVDIALATSAAPTFFPLAELHDQLFVDGGLFANSPDLIAYHEATTFLNADAGSMRMLSIGSTTARYSLSQETGTDFGAWQWMTDSRLISAMLGSQQQIAGFMMKHILRDRYKRIDYTQAPEQERYLRMDTATVAAIKDIRGMAHAATQEEIATPFIADLLAEEARKPEFFMEG